MISFQFFIVGEYIAVEFWKSRQYAFQKIIAVNAVSADQLHAAVFFAVVEQQAVVVDAVAARMTDNAVHSVGQLLGNFQYHRLVPPFVYFGGLFVPLLYSIHEKPKT